MDRKSERIESLIDLILQMKKKLLSNLNDKLVGGITFSQLVLLKHINLGFRTVSELAIKLSVTPPAASKLVDQLCTMELVERIRSKDDRRIVMIELTVKGNELLQTNEKIRHEEFRKKMEVLNPEELDAFIHILEKLNNRLD